MLFAAYSSSADLSIYNVEDFDSTSWGLAKTIPDVFSQGATALSHNGSRLYAANGNHYLLSSLIVIDTGSNNIDDWDIIRSIGISEYNGLSHSKHICDARCRTCLVKFTSRINCCKRRFERSKQLECRPAVGNTALSHLLLLGHVSQYI